MKVVELPKQDEWQKLLSRPGDADTTEISATVAAIINDVRECGDAAVLDLTERFDGCRPETMRVTRTEIDEAAMQVSAELRAAIDRAAENIRRFHAVEIEEPRVMETSRGVFCWRRTVPIQRVGLYVPAGSAPLFSTVLMLAIPARAAGCPRIVMTTPPGPGGQVDPAVLYAARICGVDEIYKVGGAQAIAALAFGTASIPRVDKIFGPGNRFVTEAKLQVMRFGTAIDMPAGPSEVAVLADESCEPDFVAADLLAQAEHGPDSHVVLVSPARDVIDAVIGCLPKQLANLPRRSIAERALANSIAIRVQNLTEGIELINEYAPEHLILAVSDPDGAAELIKNAGSVFVGHLSCESAGDYASGTNHTLPTGGAARGFSGLSTASFLKTITFQRLTPDGITDLGPVIETMAAGERLDAHRNAVAIRRNYLEQKNV